MVMAREYAMNQTLANFPAQEFRATKGGGLGQILLFAAMAAGCAYLAYSSLTPDYWTDFSYYELEFIGKVMNLFPIPVRALICVALMMMCLNAARMKLARNATDTPLLILSKEGVSGFKNGFAKEHTFISWDQFKSATTVNKSSMIFHGKPEHMLGKRATIGVSLPEIGVKYADMVPLMEAYQLAWAHSQILGQTLGQRQPQQQYAQAPEQRPALAPAKRPEPQPGQFMKPNVPDFGKRLTRL
jgi:hypothetical protein